ncbi:MAG TPA: hypothetical protein DIC56_20100 [Rhizobium sp.]|nr:hypothetical protein [Rhizobium sp.]
MPFAISAMRENGVAVFPATKASPYPERVIGRGTGSRTGFPTSSRPGADDGRKGRVLAESKMIPADPKAAGAIGAGGKPDTNPQYPPRLPSSPMQNRAGSLRRG